MHVGSFLAHGTLQKSSCRRREMLNNSSAPFRDVGRFGGLFPAATHSWPRPTPGRDPPVIDDTFSRGVCRPPGKIKDFCETVATFHCGRDGRDYTRYLRFMGETRSLVPPGDIPPRVFLLRPCASNPTGRDRRGTPRKQQHDGVSHGSRAIHRGQGGSVNPCGCPSSL